MKKFIIFFCLAFIIFIQNTRLYSQEESGKFYFLKSTDNDKQSIMYLHIIGNEVYGSYHIPNTSFDFYGNIKNGNIEANLYEQFSSNAGGNINAKFDDNKITLKGKYNSDKYDRRKSHRCQKSDTTHTTPLYRHPCMYSHLSVRSNRHHDRYSIRQYTICF